MKKPKVKPKPDYSSPYKTFNLSARARPKVKKKLEYKDTFSPLPSMRDIANLRKKDTR